MATLEDKILGEKQQYYCSSSSGSDDESNDEDCDESEGAACRAVQHSSLPEPDKSSDWNGVSSNTGPKGVLKDWQRFKQLETEKRVEQEKERIALMKKLSITCKSVLEEENGKEDEVDAEFAELLTDDFIQQYRKQRMSEMLSNCAKLPNFGKLIHLKDGDEFLEALDNENKFVTVVVHIYENNVTGCKMMNRCLAELSEEYCHVKFCKLVGSSAGMSSHFKSDGVPALLVYKGGQMVGNFIRVTDELGDEFYSNDVENYLVEHGMIIDKSCVPKIVNNQSQHNNDSDESLE